MIDLVVHGHFYQPPREDPWTGEVPRQPSAAPAHDWNERITDECYRPCTAVEVVDAPTGKPARSTSSSTSRSTWDRRSCPGSSPTTPTSTRAILEADRRGGRAIAQAYGHAILPLCDDRDLRTQVRWGIADFRHRFGRAPEGIWLPETAVSERVLAVVAEEGVRFTILAPGQLRADPVRRR